jgi:toxin HigB-1
VILSFRHKGLERMFARDDARGVSAAHATKLKRILVFLNRAGGAQAMDLPGFRLHQLVGNRRGTWAVDVSRNWRVTFRFDGADAVDVDYEDYH